MRGWVKIEPEMSWPGVGDDWAQLEWTLRHGQPTRSDILAAAACLDAYRALVWAPRKKRDHVVRELRAHSHKEAPGWTQPKE